MNPLIRIFFALLFLTLAVSSAQAGSGSIKPVKRFMIRQAQISSLDSWLSVSRPLLAAPEKKQGSSAVVSRSRICSCQILDLESSNYDHRDMVLLAEKTVDGSSAAYTLAKNRIQKEKKQLKKMFYDKVKVVAETQEAGSCEALFSRLKTADSHLQLYEILDADVR